MKYQKILFLACLSTLYSFVLPIEIQGSDQKFAQEESLSNNEENYLKMTLIKPLEITPVSAPKELTEITPKMLVTEPIAPTTTGENIEKLINILKKIKQSQRKHTLKKDYLSTQTNTEVKSTTRMSVSEKDRKKQAQLLQYSISWFSYIQAGNLTQVKHYLQTFPDLFNYKNDKQKTALQVAQQYGQTNILKYLISYDWFTNIKNGNLNQIKKLYSKYNSLIKAKNSKGETGLEVAEKYRRSNIIPFLKTALNQHRKKTIDRRENTPQQNTETTIRRRKSNVQKRITPNQSIVQKGPSYHQQAPTYQKISPQRNSSNSQPTNSIRASNRSHQQPNYTRSYQQNRTGSASQGSYSSSDKYQHSESPSSYSRLQSARNQNKEAISQTQITKTKASKSKKENYYQRRIETRKKQLKIEAQQSKNKNDRVLQVHNKYGSKTIQPLTETEIKEALA